MAAIDLLPNELLSSILRYLPRETSTSALTYLLVCRRWNEVFEPILYEAVTISDEQGQYAIHPARFLQMMAEKPYLARHVRDIAFPLEVTTELMCNWVHEIIDRTLPLSKVALPSGHMDKLLPITRKVARLEIHTLEVFGASLMQLIEMFASSSLIKIRVSQGTWSKGFWNGDCFPLESTPLPPLAELKYDGFQQREGSMKTMHLVRMKVTPESLFRFLQWPRALTELELVGMQDSRRSHQFSLSEVTKLFDIHRQTLRRIRVGIIPWEREGPVPHSVIDVSAYPELQSITISSKVLFEQEPAFVAKRLLAPKIRDISINFEPESYWGNETPDDFNKETATWIENLIIEICRQRQTQLPALHLIFDPATSPRTGAEHWLSKGTWPWDYIEPLKQFAADRGVTLTSLEFNPYHSRIPIFRPGIDLDPLRIRRPALRAAVV